MATHIISVSRQRVDGHAGFAVALTIDLGNGESITTLIRHFRLDHPSSVADSHQQMRAEREGWALFYALNRSEKNTVLMSSDRARRTSVYCELPPVVDLYFNSQVIR